MLSTGSEGAIHALALDIVDRGQHTPVRNPQRTIVGIHPHPNFRPDTFRQHLETVTPYAGRGHRSENARLTGVNMCPCVSSPDDGVAGHVKRQKTNVGCKTEYP
jgi:hypothetical protein